MFQILNILNSVTWPLFEGVVMLTWFSTFLSQRHYSWRILVRVLPLLYVVNIIGNGFDSAILRAIFSSTAAIAILYILGRQQRLASNQSIILLYAIVSSFFAYWIPNLEKTVVAFFDVEPVIEVSLDFLANVFSLGVAIIVRKFKYQWLTEAFLLGHPKLLKGLLWISLCLRIINDFCAYLFATDAFFGSIWLDFFLLVVVVILVILPAGLSYRELLLSKLKQHGDELEATHNYTHTLESHYAEYLSFKHDYKNIVSSLEYGIQLGNLSDIKTTYYSVIKTSEIGLLETRDLHLYLIVDINLKSAILVKYQYAKDLGVNFSVEINQPFQVSKFENDLNFYRLFNILIDNAIEAAAPSEKKIVTILFIDSKQIVIRNSYMGHINVENIATMGYSSKSDHSGFGLYFVNQYIAQHDHISLTTTVNSEIFTQKLLF